jgi:hypothetical protein
VAIGHTFLQTLCRLLCVISSVRVPCIRVKHQSSRVRVIDYCLVAADVHASMRHCKVVHGINVKPHMLVSCEVSAEAANASIEVAGGPRPFPKSLAYGPCARPGAQ